jgi:hypothetical protein
VRRCGRVNRIRSILRAFYGLLSSGSPDCCRREPQAFWAGKLCCLKRRRAQQYQARFDLVLLARIGTIFPCFWLIIRPTAMPGQALPPTCTFLNVGQVCQFVFPSTCHSSDIQRILSAFVCMYCGVWKLLLLPTECCRRFWSQHILFFRVIAVQQIEFFFVWSSLSNGAKIVLDFWWQRRGNVCVILFYRKKIPVYEALWNGSMIASRFLVVSSGWQRFVES